MEQTEQTDPPMSASMSMSTSTSTFTEMTTSAINVHSSTNTSTTSSIPLSEDVVMQVINSSPASVHEDIWGGSQAINFSSSCTFTGVDMSSGGMLPGIASFCRPMTVAHEAYRPNVQRLGTITGLHFPSPETSSNVMLGTPSNAPQFTNTSFISEQQMKAQSENCSNEKAYENQLMMNYLQKDYEPKSVKEIVQRIDYIVHETLMKHVLTGQLQCWFPLSMIVSVVGGGVEWIESLNVE